MSDPILSARGVPLVGQPLAVPMGVQLHAFETEKGVSLESRRERFVLAAMAAFAARESSTLANAGMIGRLAVNLADATLAAMLAPSSAPASSPVAPPAGEAG